MTVQPAKKPGSVKKVFCRQIVDSDISRMEDESVTLTIVAQDIYSEKAQQRYHELLLLSREKIVARIFSEKAFESRPVRQTPPITAQIGQLSP